MAAIEEVPALPAEGDRAADSSLEGLTRIHGRIHCATTPDAAEEGQSELDRIAIEGFLEVLAEVALAVARRRVRS